MDEKTELEHIAHIISKEEIEQFNTLLQKMHKANAFLEQLDSTNIEPEVPDGMIPYQIAISVNCTVSQRGASVSIAPSVVEKLQKVYYIDMTTDNYSEMVESFLDRITDSLKDSCTQFIPSPTEAKDV